MRMWVCCSCDIMPIPHCQCWQRHTVYCTDKRACDVMRSHVTCVVFRVLLSNNPRFEARGDTTRLFLESLCVCVLPWTHHKNCQEERGMNAWRGPLCRARSQMWILYCTVVQHHVERRGIAGSEREVQTDLVGKREEVNGI